MDTKKQNLNTNIYEPIGTKEPLTYEEIGFMDTKKTKASILLHSCCGPCSTAVIERLLPNYNITVFFYNPNISDKAEYAKRREAQLQVIEYFNKKTNDKIDFIDGPYESDKFLQFVKGLEGEKEGGVRCSKCFELRLEETAKLAKQKRFDTFTTTLSVSPHKDFQTIAIIGRALGEKYGVGFLEENFKKRDGFKRSIELSKKINLYRQNFCGCTFSIWETK